MARTKIDVSLITPLGATLDISGAQLSKAVTLTDATNNQKQFVAQNNGAASSALYIATNRDAATGTYTQTGQGSAQVQIQSGNNNGIVYIATANTNNGTLNNAASIQDTGCALKGTTTNNSAAAGYVGEYVASVTGTSAVTSNQYGDLTSISLTAGDWDVSLNLTWDSAGATWSFAESGISTTSGNSIAGLTIGSNRMLTGFPSSAVSTLYIPQTVANYRLSLSGTTTIYAKYLAIYTVGTPTASCRLSARRVR